MSNFIKDKSIWFQIAGWNGWGLGSHALAGPLHSVHVEFQLLDTLAFLLKLYRVYSDVCPKIQMKSIIAKSVQGPNVFYLVIQACGRDHSAIAIASVDRQSGRWYSIFSSSSEMFKRRSKLHKSWAGRLANISNSWDSTLDRSAEVQPRHVNPTPSCSIQRSENGYFVRR